MHKYMIMLEWCMCQEKLSLALNKIVSNEILCAYWKSSLKHS